MTSCALCRWKDEQNAKLRAEVERLQRNLLRLKDAADHDGDAPSLIAKVRVMREQSDALRKQEPVAYITDSGRSAVMVAGANLDDDTPLYAH